MDELGDDFFSRHAWRKRRDRAKRPAVLQWVANALQDYEAHSIFVPGATPEEASARYLDVVLGWKEEAGAQD